MTKEFLFWILMLIWLVFGGLGFRSPDQTWYRGGWAGMTFLIIAILGWAVFGPPIR